MDGRDNQHARICVLEKLLENWGSELEKHCLKQDEQFKDITTLIHNIPKIIATSREGIMSDLSKVFSAVVGTLVVLGWVYVYILKDVVEHMGN